jgi:hypothetical protein
VPFVDFTLRRAHELRSGGTRHSKAHESMARMVAIPDQCNACMYQHQHASESVRATIRSATASTCRLPQYHAFTIILHIDCNVVGLQLEVWLWGHSRHSTERRKCGAFEVQVRCYAGMPVAHTAAALRLRLLLTTGSAGSKQVQDPWCTAATCRYIAGHPDVEELVTVKSRHLDQQMVSVALPVPSFTPCSQHV